MTFKRVEGNHASRVRPPSQRLGSRAAAALQGRWFRGIHGPREISCPWRRPPRQHWRTRCPQ